jgi:hypothetical protein
MKAMIKILTFGFILFIFFGKIHAQVLIDTNTIKQANTYLVKGAIAREQVTHLRKIVTADSIIIAEQDSVITKQKVNIAYLNDENNSLLRQNKAIITTLKLFKGISIGLGILTLVGWLR